MNSNALQFLIIEKDCFIAKDMQEGLNAADNSAACRQVRSLEELPSYLDAAVANGLKNVIITKLPIDQIESSGLAGMAARTGAEIVVRQGEDRRDAVTAHGWRDLAWPFTGEDLADLVHDLQAGPSRSVA